MSGVVSGFTVIFLLIGVGFVLGRTGAIGENAGPVLSKLVFFVCTPALMIYALATNDLSVIFSHTLVIAGATAFLVGILYALIARVVFRRAIPETVVGALSSSYVNSVNLGLPIAIFVLDDASFIAPLLLFQIMIYSPICLVILDLTALPSTQRQSLWRTIKTPLTNPIVIGGVIGLAISLSGWTIPAPILSPIDMLRQSSVPLALLAFGFSLTGVAVFKRGESPRRDVVIVTILKMAVMPAAAYATSKLGFGLSGHALFAQVVIAALPTAQNVLVYATRYQRGEILARDSALVTTLVSIPVIAIIAYALA